MQINTKTKTGALAPTAGFRSRYLCLALALMTPLCAATINFDNLATTSTTDVQPRIMGIFGVFHAASGELLTRATGFRKLGSRVVMDSEEDSI